MLNDPSMAGLKAELAKLGQTVQPDAKLQYRDKPTGPVSLVVLDRVVRHKTPEYCVHGYVSCVKCDHMCWLGHETVKGVTERGLVPICLDCAKKMKANGLLPGEPDDRIEDHLRKDGPHE